MDWMVAHFAELVFFYLAGIAVIGAACVLIFRSPINAALALLCTFLAIAGVFVLAHAELLAAVQVLVYAGGIMVLFLFAIMLVNVRVLPEQPQFLRKLMPFVVPAALALAGLLLVATWGVGHLPLGDRAALTSVEGAPSGNTEAVAWSLFTQYLLPFEVVSIVLLVAIIGAIVLGRKETPGEGA